MGLNKACTFMNVPPWAPEDREAQERFDRIPWDLLRGEFVGWTATTDGFMPSLRPFFWQWVEKLKDRAKILTVVTKWPIPKNFMRQLGEIPNLFLVVSITGNPPPVEKIPVKVHLRSLALAKECGVRCLPVCHPYIPGVSDLSFLPELKKLGYSHVSVKGLRYSPSMGNWMPERSKSFYEGRGIEEVLPEDGWRLRVAEAGLSLKSPKEWYWEKGLEFSPKISREEAENAVSDLLGYVQIASSGNTDEVVEAAIRRRL
jgi:hypothetical protein